MGREISRTPQVRSSRRLRRAAVGQGEAVAASVASGVGFIEWFGGRSRRSHPPNHDYAASLTVCPTLRDDFAA